MNPNDLPRGKCGIDGAFHIDHKVSVRYGFDNNIPVEIISSHENLELIPWLDNIKKYDGKNNRKDCKETNQAQLLEELILKLSQIN